MTWEVWLGKDTEMHWDFINYNKRILKGKSVLNWEPVKWLCQF